MAISPCPKPTALDRNPPVCQTLRLWSPAALSRLRPQELARSAIFHGRGHGTTCASDDRRADVGFHPPLYWLIPPLAESRYALAPLTVLRPGPRLGW